MFQEVQLVVFGALAFSVDDFSLFVRQAHFHFGTFYLGRLSTLGVLGIVQFHIEVEVGVLVLVVEVGHYFKVAHVDVGTGIKVHITLYTGKAPVILIF